ncbi:MAG: virulence protein E [Bosea sp.]|uniref:virulence-associated E family protein n=1 Tax=Bosea sp. (in: a-proteobacteria) TaxID=1871050 RepID=UPI0023912254|nr:virulence protein E [Bosea sp. (in: a-proteobacteria)]MCP4738289.1 virulence protein E [Bosea sp. (in: a-proteobacteria)]
MALVPTDLVPVGRDKLPETILPTTLSLLENGDDPDRPRGGPNPRHKSRSESVYRAACDLARLGCSAEFIAGALLNPRFRISEFVLEKRRPEAYALRQATKAIESVAQGWPDTFKSGAPKPSMRNARAALRRLGLSFAYDMFRHRKMVEGHVVEQFAGEITDDACMMLRGLILDRLGFDPGTQHVQDAIMLMCIEEPEHPVREMLDNLKWDGIPRLETWLSQYLGAADTPFNRAVGPIMLIAAVRRVRVPGVKFDQIIVFEGTQGTGKSTAVKILAGEEFHADQEILSLEPKAQLELLDGVWLYEINELEGMNRAEVAKIKAFASRQVDRARLAYARNAASRPRQVIFIGTTNENKYLRDQTGNRRFWPVRTGIIDLPALDRDRDQLLAEAAYHEGQGASIALPPELWSDAAAEQEARVEEDPWVEQIEAAVPIVAGDKLRFVTLNLLKEVLGIRPENQNQGHTKRLSALMARLGWRKEKFKLHGKTYRGYEKDKPADYQPPPTRPGPFI